MWVWLKLKQTPEGDFCLVTVKAVLINLFMHSTKRYLNGANIVTFHPKHPK